MKSIKLIRTLSSSSRRKCSEVGDFDMEEIKEEQNPKELNTKTAEVKTEFSCTISKAN